MAGVMWIQWYATVLRQEMMAEEIARIAPLPMRYGATRYAVHRNADDRYKITQMAWFDSHDDWYRYWEGPEMIEFRARHSGHFQIPLTYGWNDELVAGELGPEMTQPSQPEPEPEPEPQAAA